MHILLEKTKAYKGILIITHNEFKHIKKYIKEITTSYYIILHLQWSMDPPRDKNISIYMVPTEYCKTEKDIPYTVVHLTDKIFNYSTDIVSVNQKLINILEKYNIENTLKIKDGRMIDFLYIGRCCGIKKTLDVLEYFKFLSKKGYIVCMIILKQSKNDEYYKKFKKLFGGNILLIDTHDMNIENDEFLGLPMSDISLFYRSSKIYIHACEDEGSSRAIHEAICSGCYLMCKKNMKGGGLNELSERNSTLYLHHNFYSKVEEAIDKSKKYICSEEDVKKCSEIFTLDIFLDKIYRKLEYKIPFEEFKCHCDVEKIQLKFPGHYFKVRWYIPGSITASITDRNIKIFMDYIKMDSYWGTKKDDPDYQKIFNSKDRRAMTVPFHCDFIINSTKTYKNCKYVEVGVAKGGVVALISKKNPECNIYALDSWEGMPELTKKDESYLNRYVGQKGKHLFGSEKILYETCSMIESPLDKLTVYKGWIEETIPKNKDNLKEIDILRVDVDWYEPVKFTLESLYFNIKRGGMVIIDDGKYEGCRKAVEEFRKKHKIENKILKGRENNCQDGYQFFWYV